MTGVYTVGTMMATILSALAVFMSTSVDDLLILTMLFARCHTRRGISRIVGGQYAGTAALVTVSLFAAYLVHFIPETWMTGFLGLVPIVLGIRVAIRRDDDKSDTDSIIAAEKLAARKDGYALWTVALITIAAGGDNLGIYIPYFSSLAAGATVVALVVLALALASLCYAGYRLSTVPLIAQSLEKYEHIIVPIVFVALGIYIMLDAGTVQKIWLAFKG